MNKSFEGLLKLSILGF